MFIFRIVCVVATGLLMLNAGSYAIADDDSDSDSDANEVSVEVEATNDGGYRLEVDVEGTSLGLFDPSGSDLGDLAGEAVLTDPSGNECEIEITHSINSVIPPAGDMTPSLALFTGAPGGAPGPGNPAVVVIAHDQSMRVAIPPPSVARFVVLGCDPLPPGPSAMIFPGDQTTVEIEED